MSLGYIVAQNTNPTVTNVAFSCSETTVTVTYDVSDPEQDVFTIYMEVSLDGGNTWDYDYGATSGDIGGNIAEGTNKSITWTYSGELINNCVVKILADDLVGDQIYDSRSRTIYNTVSIGGQTWLKENLNIGTMINSNSGNDDQTDNNVIEKYCYNNDPNYCDTYGGLYQWNEAMAYSTLEGAQGICPDGWHIPTESEFQTLIGNVSNSANALKEVGQGRGDGSGTNTSGFSARLAGVRKYTDGSFSARNDSTRIWCSKRNYNLYIYYDEDRILFGNTYNDIIQNGYSVRCIQGAGNTNYPPDEPNNPSPADTSIGVSIVSALSWNCSDNEDDPLTYNVYFGDSNNPPLVKSNHNSTTYYPVTLDYETMYYWKIVANDGQSQTEGQVWRFTTEAEP